MNLFIIGTRSTTGQLLSFKKGTFHMWEQLQVPIVPFIIIGAFDLYPVGMCMYMCVCWIFMYICIYFHL